MGHGSLTKALYIQNTVRREEETSVVRCLEELEELEESRERERAREEREIRPATRIITRP